MDGIRFSDRATLKTKIPYRQQSMLRWSSSPLSPSSRRGLDTNKLTYNPRRLVGQLKLTASAFNRLEPVHQQSWSQGTHYDAELAVSSPAVAETIASTHCTCPWRDGQAEWRGKYQDDRPVKGGPPIPELTGLHVA